MALSDSANKFNKTAERIQRSFELNKALAATAVTSELLAILQNDVEFVSFVS